MSKKYSAKKLSKQGQVAILNAVIILAVFVVVGCASLFKEGKLFLNELDARFWLEVSCVIETFDPASETLGFKYKVNGDDYLSSQFNVNHSPPTGSDFALLGNTYSHGSSHRCWVDSDNPHNAVLERGSLFLNAIFLLLPLPFIVIGVLGLKAILLPAKEKEKPAISKRSYRLSNKTIMFIMGLIPIVFGFDFLFNSLVPLGKTLSAQSWEQQECQVIQSKALVDKNLETTTYYLDILFSYQVAGKTYISNQYGFFPQSSSYYKEQQALARKYSVNPAHRCYVNLNNPREAVLSRAYKVEDIVVPFISLLIVALGVFFWFMAFARKQQVRFIQGDELCVQPAKGCIEAVLLLLLGSIFWNGALWMIFEEVFPSKADWLLLLVVLFFKLLGIIPVIAFFGCLLALLNPIPTLYLSRSIPLGGRSELRWSFNKNTHAIKRLTLRVQAVAGGDYCVETYTVSEEQVLTEMMLLDMQSISEIERGRLEFTIPENIMDSVVVPNNKVRWVVKFAANTGALRPNIRLEYDIKLTPKEPANKSS